MTLHLESNIKSNPNLFRSSWRVKDRGKNNQNKQEWFPKSITSNNLIALALNLKRNYLKGSNVQKDCIN